MEGLQTLASQAVQEVTVLTPVEHAMLWLPPFVYVAFVPACRFAMKSEAVKGAALAFRGPHNIILGTFSLIMTILSIIELARRPLSVHGLICEKVTPAPVMVAAWWISKFYEWVDSILLLAAGKELSSLHYNHHMSTATVVGIHFLGRKVRTSIFDMPLLLNALAHTFMYFYYFDPQVFRPIKKVITKIQIVQHMSVLLMILYTTYQQAKGSCDISVLGNGFSLFMYGMYLFQFLAFYVGAYLFPKKKEKKRSD